MMSRIALRCCSCKGALYEEPDNTGDATCSSCATVYYGYFDPVLRPTSNTAIKIQIEIEEELKSLNANPNVKRVMSLKDRGFSDSLISSITGHSEKTIRRWMRGGER